MIPTAGVEVENTITDTEEENIALPDYVESLPTSYASVYTFFRLQLNEGRPEKERGN